MKKLFLFLLLAAGAWAQGPTYGSLTALASSCVQFQTNTASCAWSPFLLSGFTEYHSGLTVSLSGTWSATVQFEATQGPDSAGNLNWVAINGVPLNSTTGASSATGNGVWAFAVGGLYQLRVRCSAFTSGTVLVSIVPTPAPTAANSGMGSGGPPTGSAGGDLGGTYPNPTVVSVADVTAGTLGVNHGGTGATTAPNALIGLFPTALEVGDLVYCSAFSAGNCTAWSLLAGNTSGTSVLQETSGGVPSWVTAFTPASCATTNALAIYTGSVALGCGNGDFTYATHTLTMGASGLLNLASGGANSFIIPVGAGCTSGADGVLCYDSTNKNTHARLNGADALVVQEVSNANQNFLLKSNSSTLAQAIASSLQDNGTTVASTENYKFGTAAGIPNIDLTIGTLTSAMTAQSSASCTPVTNMTWNVAANKAYKMHCALPITFAASATIAFCIGGPGTPTSHTINAIGSIGAAGVYDDINLVNNTTYGTKTTASGAVGASTQVVIVDAVIRNGSTASGTALTLQTAANGNNITMLADGVCTLIQTN